MQLDYYLQRMTHQADAVARLVDGIDAAQARWRPTLDVWSLLEVINHLYDEEVEDFRLRLEATLRDPEEAWPPNDPEAKVMERDYNSRDLAISLEKFLDERNSSLAWLRGLQNPAWESTHTTPFGTLSAGDLLVAWVAHDLLHIRQLNELHYLYQRQLAAPYSVSYAGKW